nr:excinuclease ABC subunit UvrC [Clostridium sp. MSJ-8]
MPDNPGVYLMKNSLGEVIYVGKAKILKNRVRQYFQNSKNHSEKVKAMVKNIAEFEYIVTDTEMEALILECNLIKKYSPRYNILLKDDKFYPFIKITVKEDYPRVFITRNYARDGAKYFGPYTNSTAVHEVMNLIQKIFQVRTCKRSIKEDGEKTRPCLNYHIKKCKAPCNGGISKEEYGKMIKEIMDILNGTNKTIISELKKEMLEYSEKLEFEKAALVRDRINAIEALVEKQKIFNKSDSDEDFINIFRDEECACIQVFFFREGKINGREHFIIQDTKDETDEDILEQFIVNFYSGTAIIPKNIYVPGISDIEVVEELLSVKRGSKVSIKIPQIGEKLKMINLVKENATLMLQQFKSKILKEREKQQEALEELTERLNLEEIPYRIESYDISNIQGVDSVGTMIVFEDGKPKNSDYRRFKIKTVKGADDYSSMREILTRRFERGLNEIKEIQDKKLMLSKGKFHSFPDLIMMDGGKGQVNIALEVLNKLGINIEVCGLVKDDKHRTRAIIYNNKEIIIRKDSELMYMITRIQDEVHRFAITYHRTLRDKRTLHSILDDIPNIGERRRKDLLMHFGSVDNIKKATREELQDVKSLNKKSIDSIIEYFRNNNKK